MVKGLICIETILWLDILLNEFPQTRIFETQVNVKRKANSLSCNVHITRFQFSECYLRLVRNKLTQSGFSLNCFEPLENYIHHLTLHNIYYMASSVSGQEEPNRALGLARAGKRAPSCPLGTTRCIP